MVPLLASIVACDGGQDLALAPLVSEGAERLVLADVQFLLAAGQSETVAWVGPSAERLTDLLGLTVYVEGNAGQRLTVGVQDNDSGILTDPSTPEFSVNRSLGGVGTVVAQVPVASVALPLMAPYTIRVRRFGTDLPQENLSLRVWGKYARISSTAPKVQALDVQWVLAGGAASEPQLTLAIERARNIWRQAGIEIVEKPRITLDNSMQPPFAPLTIEPALGSDSPELKRLLLLSAMASVEGVPLFLVDEIALLPSGALWAIAGGIPVPPAANTERSGLAVSASLLQRDPKYAGQIIAHELGHALGLFHTTESVVLTPAGPFGQAINDGIRDTPPCPATADRDGDRRLSDGECRDFDAGNLMFWGTTAGAIDLTPGQGDVARRSLLTH